MRLRTLWIPIILLSLAGCGEDGTELEKGPFLKVDRLRMEFDTEFGSGTYVGATGFNSLYIENGGDEPLEITKVTKSGDAFALRLPEDVTLPYKLDSLKRTFVEVRFTPPEAKTYEGKLVIEWGAVDAEAADLRKQEIALAGRGISPP